MSSGRHWSYRPSSGMTAPLVVGGVVLAHTLDYVAVFADPARRDAELTATGHGYWPAALATAAVATVAVVARAVLAGVRRGRRPATGAATPFPVALVRLAFVQMAAFGAVEVGERLVARAPVAGLVWRPELGLGLLLQVAVAAAFLALLGTVEHVAASVTLGARRRRRAHAPPGVLVAVLGHFPADGAGHTGARPRAPPSLAPVA